MQTIKQFAKNLSNERKRLKLTQAEFAHSCGVKPASQFLYEKGERTPNAEYLLKASLLGVHIGYLFEGSTSMRSLDKISPVELGKIYKQCDDQCRDSVGRLLDLELRTATFISMVETVTNKNCKGVA